MKFQFDFLNKFFSMFYKLMKYFEDFLVENENRISKLALMRTHFSRILVNTTKSLLAFDLISIFKKTLFWKNKTKD